MKMVMTLQAALAALALAATASGAARAPATDKPGNTDRQLEQQLAAARERLDAAARDVARLSGELYGSGNMDLMKFVQGHAHGSMLGVNIGSERELPDGVEVVGVSPGGPAERAGLRTGDVIVSVDGQALRRQGERSAGRQLVDHLRGVEPGTRVKVAYRRGDKSQVVEVTTVAAQSPLARMLRDRQLLPLPEGIELPDFERFIGDPSALRGLEIVAMTPRLGQYFGTDDGLLVVRAATDARLPLQEGDVLLSIDGRVPDSPGHALRILRSYESGEAVKLRVLRMRKTVDLELKMPSRGPAAPAPGSPPPPTPPPAPARRDSV